MLGLALGMFIALFVIMLIFAITTKGTFVSSRNLSNLLNQTGYIAVLADLSSSCRYYNDDSGQGVDVDLNFKLIAERGPALSGNEEVTYFVATVGPGNQIVSRDVLSGDLPFTEGAERVGLSEDLTLRLPSITAAQGRAYTLYVGFQLDEAQLERQQPPALR